MRKEEVVLVNEADEAIGSMEKMMAHEKALLHRAFSVFLFNEKGEMLLQQRALSKYHSGGLWTNACCSHPYPGEAVHAATNRRLGEELGITANLKHAFSFTYRAAFDNGLTEHEYDHVFVGAFQGDIPFNTAEVMACRYIGMKSLEQEIAQYPEQYTAWFKIALDPLKKFLATTQSVIAHEQQA